MDCPYFKQSYDTGVCTIMRRFSLPIDQMSQRCFKEGFATCSVFMGMVTETGDLTDDQDETDDSLIFKVIKDGTCTRYAFRHNQYPSDLWA